MQLLFQGCPYFRGTLISGVSLFQGYPYFRCVLISGVSSFQGYPYFKDINALISRISSMPLFQWCSYFRSVLILAVLLFQGCPYFRGTHISGVPLFQGCPFRMVPFHSLDIYNGVKGSPTTPNWVVSVITGCVAVSAMVVRKKKPVC